VVGLRSGSLVRFLERSLLGGITSDQCFGDVIEVFGRSDLLDQFKSFVLGRRENALD
jgi:hypothetical protein